MNANSTPSKEEVFPDLSGKSVHLSTDEPDLHALKQWVSNEGLHPGVHAEDTHAVISHWGPSFQGIACPIPESSL